MRRELGVIEDKFTLVLYGLPADGDAVRADVFAKKLTATVKALQAADKVANGKRRHRYVIDGLEVHSALVKVRGRATGRLPRSPGAALLGEVFSKISSGAVDLSDVPPKLLEFVGQIAAGAESSFSHAEVIYANDNVVRIDDFFLRRLELVRRDAVEEVGFVPYFEGAARQTFDGLLNLIDGRGELPKALLHLTAGGRTIECIMRREILTEALGSGPIKGLRDRPGM